MTEEEELAELMKRDDLVTRLRKHARGGMHEIGNEAAGEIECLRRIISDIRVLYHSGQFKQFEGEPWLRRVLNIDLQR